MKNFLKDYYQDIHSISVQDLNNISKLKQVKKMIKDLPKKNKLIFCGNGGSSATCSHVSVDFTKNAKINSINFNETDFITCLSNDYGFENLTQDEQDRLYNGSRSLYQSKKKD